MVWFIRAVSVLRMVWFIRAISVLRMVWFIRTISVQIFSLHDHTTSNLYCSIADFFETQDNWNVLSLAAYPQHRDSHSSMYSFPRISNATNPCLAHPLPAAQQWWRLHSRGGSRAVAQHATFFSMLRRVLACF
jgi:hypothetical protein